MFLRLLKTEMQSYKNLEALKQSLFSHFGFTVEEMFKMIDQDGDGRVTTEELGSLMSRYSLQI